MSDVTKAEVPGQAVGTVVAPVSAEGQSRAAVTPGQEPASQDGTEAKPVTAQDLQALEERLGKQIQSQVDKSSARVQKKLAEVDQAVAVLRASGREITDADVKTLKQNAAAQAMIEPEAEPITPAENDPFDAGKWNQSDPAVQVVLQAQTDAKMTINADDPEAKMINRTNAAAWIKSNLAALEAKAVRLQSASNVETKTTSPAAARIPAKGGAPLPTYKTAKDLWEKAH